MVARKGGMATPPDATVPPHVLHSPWQISAAHSLVSEQSEGALDWSTVTAH